MLSLRVTDPNGTHTVVTRPWTLSQWELRHKTKLSRIESEGIGMADYLWLAWRQLSDDGVVSATFDAWGPTVTAVELDAGADADRPTQQAQSDG